MTMLHRWGVSAVTLTVTMAWADDKPKAGKDDAADRTGMIYVSEMLDTDLTNEVGENIGDIEDAILTTDGRLHYLIIGEGASWESAKHIWQSPSRSPSEHPERQRFTETSSHHERQEGSGFGTSASAGF